MESTHRTSDITTPNKSVTFDTVNVSVTPETDEYGFTDEQVREFEVIRNSFHYGVPIFLKDLYEGSAKEMLAFIDYIECYHPNDITLSSVRNIRLDMENYYKKYKK